MIYNLEDVKRMFMDPDKIIQSRPELLSMDIDEIFDELNDGTQEMIHNRWGVMTRVKMQELQSIDNEKIIDFLLDVKERNLLCEYIGFILQYEYGVGLLALLLNAYERGVHNEIIPFVEQCIDYEEECFVERLDDILEILNSLTKENEKFSFIYNYSELVVRKEKEEVIFYKYLEDFSETLSQIVYQIGSRLFSIRKEVAEKWLEIFLEKDSKTYRNMGISFVERSLYVDVSIFEKHFLFLENISSDTELWKQLIPLYTCYISMNCKKKYEEDVNNHLKMLKEGTVEEKRICIQSLELKVKESEICKEIMDILLDNSFEKDNQILNGIDYYFEDFFARDSMSAIKKLYKTYEINKFGNNDHFIETLPCTMKELKKHQSQIVNIWWENFMHGSDEAFFLSIEIFCKALSIDCVIKMIKETKPSQKDVICFLDGMINEFPYFAYAPYDVSINVVIMIYRLLIYFGREKEVLSLFQMQVETMMYHFKWHKKFPAPSDNYEEALEIENNVGSVQYDTSSFWGYCLLMIATLDCKEIYNKINDFLIRDLEKTTKCVWFLRKEEELLFYDYYAMNVAGEGVEITLENDYDSFKANVDFVMNQYKDEKFSFEEYSFSGLEIMICHYYNYIPKVYFSAYEETR